jgi:hypothetical protein
MQPIRLLSVVEQTAEHLRKGLYQGRWRGNLPGVVQLATEFDVAIRSMRAALQQLEAEGLLSGRGLGRSRSIAAPGGTKASLRRLRVGVLTHDVPFHQEGKTEQVLLLVKHDLEAAGHTVFSTSRSQAELQHDARRIIRHLKETPADAWIVISGSRVLLEWFAAQPVPTIALYGRSQGLPLARTGPDKVPPFIFPGLARRAYPGKIHPNEPQRGSVRRGTSSRLGMFSCGFFSSLDHWTLSVGHWILKFFPHT